MWFLRVRILQEILLYGEMVVGVDGARRSEWSLVLVVKHGILCGRGVEAKGRRRMDLFTDTSKGLITQQQLVEIKSYEALVRYFTPSIN